MKIIKMGYSRSPWRLVTKDGKEVEASMPFDHPSLGLTWVMGTVCGETKAECTEKALELLELMLLRRDKGVLL